ncbi:MAG: HD domain-containing protein [Candidatus Omnitrophica bacterium]|nr:HD domain-containing protein [Candidatus Omnitrophota bacterium]
MSAQTVAVIDIGASAIRLVVAEIGSKGEIRQLENLQKAVNFGKDVFSGGSLSQASMAQGLAILQNYKSVIDTYQVKKVQAIATSAIREAVNSEMFIDRVFVRTGIDVEVIEGPEEVRLELIAVEHAVGTDIDLNKKNCLIVEVSSGSTEVIILNQGQVELTRTLSIGSLRLPEQASSAKLKPEGVQKVLKRSIQEIVAYAAKEYNFAQVDTFIALGGDVRFAAQQLAATARERYAIVDKKPFVSLVNKIGKLTPEEIASEYGLPYGQAEPLYASLLYYLNFLSETSSESLIIPNMSMRDALLLEMSQLVSGHKRTDVSRQIMNSARHLGEKFEYDKAHSSLVGQTALKIFDALKGEHGMGSRERTLLEVSATLHDIGSYISPAGHHKHSAYLVESSEIFGLRKADKMIVSNIVRYHRRSTPKATHASYASLPRQDRAVVSKLAAILRVADSLDATHQQKIKNLEFEVGDKAFTVWVSDALADVSAERESLQDKGDLFADVFGLPVVIKQKALAA